MECPICLRKELLEKLQKSPQNQEIRLSLARLLFCEGSYIMPGVTYATERRNICKIHQQLEELKKFLRLLNTPETKTLLFGDKSKYSH